MGKYKEFWPPWAPLTIAGPRSCRPLRAGGYPNDVNVTGVSNGAYALPIVFGIP